MNRNEKQIAATLRRFGGEERHTVKNNRILFLSLMIIAWVVGLIPAAANIAFASGTSYYVSTTGSDANSGTRTEPFQTFAKAVSVLQPGDTLFVYGGTYSSSLTVTSSGSAGLPITIQAVVGQHPVIDLENTRADLISVTGSYTVVGGFEVKNSNGNCINLEGQHNIIRDSVIHECYNVGIFTDGQYDTIDSNTVYHASTINSSLTLPSGWSSGIKVQVGSAAITISNNTVYNNYGEGIAVTRGTYSTVTGNIAYDNYSVNIYIDNSYNILVENNFTVDHPNGGFLKAGNPSEGIALGEEYYAGWGAQLSNIIIQNNISAFTNHGITYFGNDSGSTNGGLKYTTIAFNTLWGSTHSEINLAYDTGQIGDLIVDNIVGQPDNNLIILANLIGISLSNNFWANAAPPPYASGSGDLIGNVQFAATPGYTAASYRLGSTSPAIGAGIAVAGVTTDFYGNARGPSYDMGAIRFRADTIGIYRPSTRTFYLRLYNSTGYGDITIKFGPGTKPYPVVGDWTGKGFDTIGDFDQSNDLFSLCTANDTTLCTNSSNVINLVFGNANDIPLGGKWGSAYSHFGIGLFRPSNGLIYLKNSLSTGYADYTMVLGIPGDIGLDGDWTSKGYDSPGVYRPSTASFYLSNNVCNCTVYADIQFAYGVSGDAPVTGDWVSQGHDGVALFRPSDGYTYLRNELSTGYADITFVYGIAGDIPVAGHWELAYGPVPNPADAVLVPPTSMPQTGNRQQSSGLGD
ncbi:MAG: right-handed parallel beta-helix repeat-containing protein [Aggregatilineales bacterium]